MKVTLVDVGNGLAPDLDLGSELLEAGLGRVERVLATPGGDGLLAELRDEVILLGLVPAAGRHDEVLRGIVLLHSLHPLEEWLHGDHQTAVRARSGNVLSVELSETGARAMIQHPPSWR